MRLSLQGTLTQREMRPEERFTPKEGGERPPATGTEHPDVDLEN